MLLHSEPRLQCPDCGKFFHNKKYLLRSAILPMFGCDFFMLSHFHARFVAANYIYYNVFLCFAVPG
jgi:hypothetical protein